MPQGKVKWFSAKKGYGFIREEEKERDIFTCFGFRKLKITCFKRGSSFEV